MEPDGLEEVALGLGPLWTRKSRVPDAGGVLGPRGVSARRGVLHMRDDVANLTAALDLEHVQIAVLTAVPRERHGDPLAIRRGHIPVDGCPAARIDGVRVEEN